MALVACVAYDPPGEPRTKLLADCLWSLCATVKNWTHHRLVVVSNGLTDASMEFCEKQVAALGGMLICNQSNVGTARAINKAWALRQPGEHALKVDSDVVFQEPGWIDKLEECVSRDPTIGIIGLKRKDLAENPWADETDWTHSKLHMLPHKPGESWLIVEKVHHVMGTCQLYNSALLDKIGYLYQMGGVYGYDDSLAAVRCEVAGFYNCFYPHYTIDHPDPGGDKHTAWKQRYAGTMGQKYHRLIQDYRAGRQGVYHGPDDP